MDGNPPGPRVICAAREHFLVMLQFGDVKIHYTIPPLPLGMTRSLAGSHTMLPGLADTPAQRVQRLLPCIHGSMLLSECVGSPSAKCSQLRWI